MVEPSLNLIEYISMNKKKNYILPDLKAARVRTPGDDAIFRTDFSLPEATVDLGKGRYYFIRTYGCAANERDSETLAGLFERMGYAKTDAMEQADVILLNTCAIRQNAEDKVFGQLGAIKQLKRNNPDLILGVCGCMAQEEATVNLILSKYPQVDLIFGTHNIHRLPDLLLNAVLSKERTVEVLSNQGEVVENLPAQRNSRHKAFVHIMYGCDKFCTYCIVPFTRGKQRSRKMADIIDEVNQLKTQGYKEVTLLGQNVNAYGKDLDGQTTFATLLEQVALTGIPRIRFTTSHPFDFEDEMITVIAKYDNIMPAIHLPVQSGNSDILKLMGRRYTREHYLTLVDKIKTAIPDVTFSTDIIVGFPNETQAQFEDTLSLVDRCQYDLAYTFIYSPREGTPAAKMEDHIPFSEKQKRLQQLNERITYYSNLNNQKYKDAIVEVLVDGPSKKNDDVWSGYTRHNKLVNFSGEGIHCGDIVQVKITEVKSYSLDGIAINNGETNE